MVVSGSRLTGSEKYASSPNSTRAREPIRTVTGLLRERSTMCITKPPKQDMP
jgi:hypothetical protein